MPATRYYDAHCHWQDAGLRPHWSQIAHDLNAAKLARAVVNGTCPTDWQSVADLAKADARVLPAFGLHPWHVNAVCNAHLDTVPTSAQKPIPEAAEMQAQRTPATAAPDSRIPAQPTQPAPLWHWLETLENFLQKFPQAAVGEIGLDNWVEDADKALQQEAFLAQLALAAKDNRPVSIHSLRADGDLLATLKTAPGLPARGIHLHGFAGSVETARQLLDMGAYFSFSDYIAEPKRTKARAVAAYIPLNRLLAETDAPDMRGPAEWQHYQLSNTMLTNADNTARHEHPTNQAPTPQTPPPKHPANITAAYACLAQLRGQPIDELAAIIENNFVRYFGS